MSIIDTKILTETVYKLCLQAGQEISPYAYEKVLCEYKKTKSIKLSHILQNAKKATEIQRPLCQDTGKVHVFLEVGNKISFSSNPIDAINEGIAKCYTENYFRKSIVENEFISGKNTENNTPATINITYFKGNTLKIKVLLKGAGCDNVTDLKMLLPTISEDEFIDYAVETILEKGKNACPPLFISIATGESAEAVVSEAEKAYFDTEENSIEIANKIKEKVNELADKKFKGFFVADIKFTAKPHHMASLPTAIVFNCHSLRLASANIEGKNIKYSNKVSKYDTPPMMNSDIKEIHTEDIESIRKLKQGEEILLTGEILIARDAAHKKMLEYKKAGKDLPFDINNKIIFYAAPCPAKDGEIIGSIGPTTAHRMDKFLPEFPTILATMGKGSRSLKAEKYIKDNNSVYFEIEGGIATILSSCFKSYKTIAFEELSTEAVSLARIEKLPATAVITNNK